MINGFPYEEYFLFDGARLVWKERPETHFKTKSAMKTFNTSHAGKVAGSKWTPRRSNTSYITTILYGKLYYLHRLVWEMHCGAIPSGMHIDHINGDGTDNRIENLRLVSHKENMKNQRMPKSNTSGCTGVYWNKSRSKWVATIMVDGKGKSLGYYKEKCDAIQARMAGEKKYGFFENHGICR